MLTNTGPYELYFYSIINRYIFVFHARIATTVDPIFIKTQILNFYLHYVQAKWSISTEVRCALFESFLFFFRKSSASVLLLAPRQNFHKLIYTFLQHFAYHRKLQQLQKSENGLSVIALQNLIISTFHVYNLFTLYQENASPTSPQKAVSDCSMRLGDWQPILMSFFKFQTFFRGFRQTTNLYLSGKEDTLP